MKLEDGVYEDSYIGDSYFHDANTLKENVLNGISVKVYKLEFNCIDEIETFYNIFAKVIGFSIQKDDLKRDKNGDIVSWKLVYSREGHRLTKFFEKENRQRKS